MNNLKAVISQGANVSGSNNTAGLSSGPGSSNNLNKTSTFKTGTTNTTSLGADEAHQMLYSIPASGTVQIDLTALVNLAGVTVSFARVKAYRFHLLKATETTADGVQGTACSMVTIGNAATNGNQLDMGAQTHTMSVQNGSCKSHAGESASGICTVDATHKEILLTNNDTTNIAKLLVTLIGGSN
jgi:hypothetical protein